ncbi:unnamed protein product [Caenorhabditis angaria]|uniref:J domain-containing protein n=1 Tax=Caenorhabditis angaria TaxID=860376 RepID=A0A9P1IPC1_9PELO|nr:unnamed protein product [Caenorhabditis angaria]
MSFVDAILGGTTKKAEYYEVLGCDRNASLEQIQAEYKARVRGCHPDKVAEIGDEEKIKLANLEFSKLQVNSGVPV